MVTETTSPIGSESQSTISNDIEVDGAVADKKSDSAEVNQGKKAHNPETTLLDLYCGCGAMSTGLCLGANLCGTNLVTVSVSNMNLIKMHFL